MHNSYFLPNTGKIRSYFFIYAGNCQQVYTPICTGLIWISLAQGNKTTLKSHFVSKLRQGAPRIMIKQNSDFYTKIIVLKVLYS